MKNNKFLSAAVAAAVAGSLLLGAAEVAKADWDDHRHDNGYHHRFDHPRYWHHHRVVERYGYYREGIWVPGPVSYGYYVGNIWYPYVPPPPPRHGGVDLDINIPIR